MPRAGQYEQEIKRSIALDIPWTLGSFSFDVPPFPSDMMFCVYYNARLSNKVVDIPRNGYERAVESGGMREKERREDKG